MGRKKKIHVADLRYQLRLTADDREAWEAAAVRERLPLSDWIRSTLARACGGTTRPKATVVEIETCYADGRSE